LVPTGRLGYQPSQVCVFGENRFLVADVFQPFLLTMDSTGALVERLEPIWRDLVQAGVETNQKMLWNDGTGSRCLVALFSGRGFALLSPGQEPVVAPYVEKFDVFGIGPRKKEGKMEFWAAVDAEFVADTLMVLFSGKTKDKGRLIDRYNGTSGKYIDTYRLPFRTGDIAAGGGIVFALDSSGTAIVALRPHP
jgi:hypothetical protein